MIVNALLELKDPELDFNKNQIGAILQVHRKISILKGNREPIAAQANAASNSAHELILFLGEMPSSFGKTTMIAMYAKLLHKLEPQKKIVTVFPGKLLS